MVIYAIEVQLASLCSVTLAHQQEPHPIHILVPFVSHVLVIVATIGCSWKLAVPRGYAHQHIRSHAVQTLARFICEHLVAAPVLIRVPPAGCFGIGLLETRGAAAIVTRLAVRAVGRVPWVP